MPLLPPYTTGTITVAANGTTVTGSSTVWSDLNAREGDWLRDPATGYLTVVSARVDATHLTVPAWKGAAITAGAYQIFPYSPLRFVGGTAMADVQALLAVLNGRTFYTVIGASPTADGLVADEGQYALKTNSGAWQLWLWTAGAWVIQSQPVGVTYRGEWSGATAYVANDRVSRNGQSFTAKQANTNHDPATDTSFAYWDGGGIKGDAGTNGSTWTSGTAVPTGGNAGDFYFRSSTSDIYKNVAGTWGIVANVAGTNGANGTSMRGGVGGPSNSIGADGDRYFRTDTSDVYVKSAGAWSVEANVKGVTGATPVISGTSSSFASIAPGALGVQGFTTQSGLAFAPGMKLRIANAGGNLVLTGSVVSYSGSLLSIKPDYVQSAGGDNNWTITATGERGQDGGVGPAGAASSVPGPQGAASTVPGPQGIQGAPGQGIQPDATGTLAQRATYDNQPIGFKFLETDVSPFKLWIKASNTTADWAGPTYIGGAAAVGDLGSTSDPVTQTVDLGVAA